VGRTYNDPEEESEPMKRNGVRALSFVACLAVAFALVSDPGTAGAKDEWFVLSEQTIKSVDQGIDVKSEGNRWKNDVKQIKFSVEGADVELTKVTLKWDNRPDQTLTDIGVVKAGGQSTPKDAPGLKARLSAATIQYKIVGNAPTAKVKIWGYD
jgi:hypothetical protein